MPEEKKSSSKLQLPSITLTPSVSILISGVIIAGAIVFTNHQNANIAAAKPQTLDGYNLTLSHSVTAVPGICSP